jgi:hypothetical protein
MNFMEINVFDQLLYHLSHIGKLSWEKFKYAIGNLTGGQRRFKYDSTYLSILARLAHLDYDPMKLDRVFIAPTVLVETAVTHRYVLAGSRTPDFINDIAECVSDAGGSSQQIPNRYAPTVVVLSELTEASLAELESLGIHVSRAFSAKLSNLLPSPRRNSFLIHEAPLPAPVNRFNLRTLEFEPNYPPRHNDGLYEIPQFGRNVYVLKSGADQRIVPRAWGEWLFLSACGRKKGLTFYEQKSQTWCVNSKLHLPLTLDRCATLCSGFPPELRDDLFCYADVPVGIAYRLTKAIYQNWEVV